MSQKDKSQKSAAADKEAQGAGESAGRKAAREMGLYFQEGPAGLVHWLGPGAFMYERLRELSARLHESRGYEQVKSPCLVDMALLERSGHKDKYGALIYSASAPRSEGEGEGEGEAPSLALRPMSCPSHIRMYQSQRRSWRELPARYFEFGEVFRFEPSGSLQELLRQRQFCQDDSHVFCPLEQAGERAGEWVGMAREAYALLGFPELSFALSLRPQRRLGSDEQWDVAEGALREALSEWGAQFSEEPGGGAFYGPKIEIHIGDGLGRSWQMGVFQLDLQLPERFDLSYHNALGGLSRPALIHHAVFGSLERMAGILLERHGKELPLWLHPRPAVVVPVSEKSLPYARALSERGRAVWGRCELDASDGPLGAKLKKWRGLGARMIAVAGEAEARAWSEGRGWPARVGGAERSDPGAWGEGLGLSPKGAG